MVKKVFTGLYLLFLQHYAQAHPGHDHGASNSDVVHAVFYLCLFAVAVVAIYLATKILQKHSAARKTSANQITQE